MKNYLSSKTQSVAAALALYPSHNLCEGEIGQGYSPSRCQIIVWQKWWGMLHVIAIFIAFNMKFNS